MPRAKKIQVHGHRGFRGKFPENTITSFLEAIKAGADFIELDVVISKDRKVVVSHEPWMNPAFCTLPDGKPVPENTEKEYNLYQMDYTEIAAFDCGSRCNPGFPGQHPVPEKKPLLQELFEAVNEFSKTHSAEQIKFNIEIKSDPEGDGIFHPAPGEFVDLVLEELDENKAKEKVMLQSFDVRILQEIRKKENNIPLSFLVENKLSPEVNLNLLSFTPDIYGPEHILIDDHLIDLLRENNIRLIPWTVNSEKDMKRMIDLGVDGIITDFPDRAVKLLRQIKV